MLRISFAGWFECRLATDPDPADEPRGVSGWTFALPGEPDLDRKIRTNPQSAVRRLFAPRVGLKVLEVQIGRQAIAGHDLLGGSVEFLDEPVFEGRSGLASEDAEEPIFPFHIQVQGQNIVLRREYRDVSTGSWTFGRSVLAPGSPAVLQRAGTADEDKFFAERLEKLEAALAEARDDTAKTCLEFRLRYVRQYRDRGKSVGPVPLVGGLKYHYVMEGPWAEVVDPNQRLGCKVGGGPWIADLWVGCWDADTLCGYIDGQLTIPTV